PAARGLIYDRNGKVLVTSRFAYRVSLMPPVRDISDNVLKTLAEILDMSYEEIHDQITVSARYPYEPIVIKTDVPTELIIEIQEKKSDLPGVIIDSVPVREYPYGDAAAHILGRLGRISEEQLSLWK